MASSQVSNGQALQYQLKKTTDTVNVQTDIFHSEFDKEKSDTVLNQKLVLQQPPPEPADAVLKDAKLFDYNLKFSAESFTAGFNNDVLGTMYQPYTGSLPINLGGNEPFNAMFKAAVFDLFEDIRFTGALRLPSNRHLCRLQCTQARSAGTSKLHPRRATGHGKWGVPAAHLCSGGLRHLAYRLIAKKPPSPIEQEDERTGDASFRCTVTT